MKNKRAIILTTCDGDWEMLYIDGELYDEAHNLGEGDRFYLLKISDRLCLDLSDFCEYELSDSDTLSVRRVGGGAEFIWFYNSFVDY